MLTTYGMAWCLGLLDWGHWFVLGSITTLVGQRGASLELSFVQYDVTPALPRKGIVGGQM